MAVDLLHYRPWRGTFRGSASAVWPIARLSLAMLLRRKLFWGLYALSLLIFFLFFFGQYMLFWAEAQAGQSTVSVIGRQVEPRDLVRLFRNALKLNGTGQMYRTFFWYQGYMVMILLALAGSLLVGNDIRHGSLPFYLSKPIAAWHYLAGKCLAVAVFINFMTTIPAICLFVQYGVLDTYDYFAEYWHLLFGIIGYGLVLTCVMSLLLVATAVAVRRTVPMIMAWTTLFFFFRMLARALVDRLGYDPRWKLIDLWNNMYLVGNALLDVSPRRPWRRQPELFEASLVLTVVSLTCLIYLIRRLRAVEIVT